MPADHTFPTDRPTLTRLLFPAGVPILWSPTLVFYDEAGRRRMGEVAQPGAEFGSLIRAM